MMPTLDTGPARSAKDALGRVWKEVRAGGEWIVDADLKDFFGSVDHEKLMTLLNGRISDSRVLRLIKKMLTAERSSNGKLMQTEQGTPQGGVACSATFCSPHLIARCGARGIS
ncbi:MAG: reverse transcriptase domain-containing protein [Syntrophobacteraceae bacterium]